MADGHRERRRHVGLELDDIQSGALHERPSPYVGRYLLLRIDDRAAGRELVRRLQPVVDSGRPSADPARDAWVTVAFTYQRAEGAGRAAGVARQLRAGVPAGHGGARAPSSATSARAARPTGRSRSEPPTSTWRWRRSRPTPSGWRRSSSGRAAPTQELAGRRGDLAAGLLPAPDRAHLLRLQGRDRPAGGRGQRHSAARTRRSGRSRPARSSSATRTRRASCRRCRPRTCSAATAPTSSSASCTPASRPTGSTCANEPSSREEEALLGAKMVGRWQSGAPLALAPGPRRSRARRRPAAQQRLPLRRRSARLQVPGRRARAAGQPARRARRRRQRQRPPPPHDPARHELRPDAARGRPRGRRRRPRHHLRVRRRAPEAPVRVRQDAVAERRHLHRRTGREGPARRAERRVRRRSPSRSGRSAAACRTCRRSSSPAAASTASRRACARCAGWRSWTPDREQRDQQRRTT